MVYMKYHTSLKPRKSASPLYLEYYIDQSLFIFDFRMRKTGWNILYIVKILKRLRGTGSLHKQLLFNLTENGLQTGFHCYTV